MLIRKAMAYYKAFKNNIAIRYRATNDLQECLLQESQGRFS